MFNSKTSLTTTVLILSITLLRYSYAPQPTDEDIATCITLLSEYVQSEDDVGKNNFITLFLESTEEIRNKLFEIYEDDSPAVKKEKQLKKLLYDEYIEILFNGHNMDISDKEMLSPYCERRSQELYALVSTFPAKIQLNEDGILWDEFSLWEECTKYVKMLGSGNLEFWTNELIFRGLFFKVSLFKASDYHSLIGKDPEPDDSEDYETILNTYFIQQFSRNFYLHYKEIIDTIDERNGFFISLFQYCRDFGKYKVYNSVKETNDF